MKEEKYISTPGQQNKTNSPEINQDNPTREELLEQGLQMYSVSDPIITYYFREINPPAITAFTEQNGQIKQAEICCGTVNPELKFKEGNNTYLPHPSDIIYLSQEQVSDIAEAVHKDKQEKRLPSSINNPRLKKPAELPNQLGITTLSVRQKIVEWKQIQQIAKQPKQQEAPLEPNATKPKILEALNDLTKKLFITIGHDIFIIPEAEILFAFDKQDRQGNMYIGNIGLKSPVSTHNNFGKPPFISLTKNKLHQFIAQIDDPNQMIKIITEVAQLSSSIQLNFPQNLNQYGLLITSQIQHTRKGSITRIEFEFKRK